MKNDKMVFTFFLFSAIHLRYAFGIVRLCEVYSNESQWWWDWDC